MNIEHKRTGVDNDASKIQKDKERNPAIVSLLHQEQVKKESETFFLGSKSMDEFKKDTLPKKPYKIPKIIATENNEREIQLAIDDNQLIKSLLEEEIKNTEKVKEMSLRELGIIEKALKINETEWITFLKTKPLGYVMDSTTAKNYSEYIKWKNNMINDIETVKKVLFGLEESLVSYRKQLEALAKEKKKIKTIEQAKKIIEESITILFDEMTSDAYLKKLTTEFGGDTPRAMKTLESRIENLSNAQIEFFCNPRLPIGGQYIFGKNLKTGEIYNTIYYNLWDFNRNTALHEIGHGTQVLNGVSLFSEKAKLLYGKHINALVYKELCKNKKIPLIETLFGYFTDIMELGVRKNETERFLIKTGLKKVDEPVTKEHIKILMGLARLGLLPEGVAQFVLLYREEVLLEIFQTIAETRGRIQIIQKIADIESFLPKVRVNKG